MFFKILGTLSSEVAGSISSKMPSSGYLLQKYLMLEEDNFESYVVCPSCFSLYMLDSCFQIDSSGEKVPKHCTFIWFPNHPQSNRHLPCNTPLLKKVHLSGGKVVYKPKDVYAYQPLKKSLQHLLMRPGFSDKLEHWRSREAEDKMVYDI